MMHAISAVCAQDLIELKPANYSSSPHTRAVHMGNFLGDAAFEVTLNCARSTRVIATYFLATFVALVEQERNTWAFCLHYEIAEQD